MLPSLFTEGAFSPQFQHNGTVAPLTCRFEPPGLFSASECREQARDVPCVDLRDAQHASEQGVEARYGHMALEEDTHSTVL